ncbi:hypothetical protein FN846DRAFT_816081 [Sphaerosporella brunnea]|uniref:Vps72/YL1 C-terminal domain-containing protein n=1 Tax=Sphaerosporella brunnea TaxID=1250544 RepID=A0A5J5EQ74_9PEZI|nr:hypothetical protein FN846DRAFT_816081 [Sphaerosporella brunnea]
MTTAAPSKKHKTAGGGSEKAAAAAATAAAAAAAAANPLLEALDISPHPKPFKNKNYKPPARRNKNLKQILADSAANATTARALQAAPPTTYQNIEGAPSLRRGNKWCDVTGLPARYTDPKTKLRYRDGEVYHALRNLPAGGTERYLEVRGANVVLK